MNVLTSLPRLLAFDWRVLTSVLLCVAAFPPWDLYPLLWFALVFWFLGLETCRTYRQAFLKGWWWSLGATLGAFYWTAYAMHQFGELNWGLSFAGLFLFSFLCQPQAILFSLFWFWQKRFYGEAFKKRSPGFLFFICLQRAFVYIAIERILGKIFTDTLGNGFYMDPYFRQLASVGGAQFLTFIVVFVNLGLFELIQKLRERDEPSIWPSLRWAGPVFFSGLGLFVASYTYGFFEAQKLEALIQNPKERFHFGVIQGNIGDFEKVAAETGSGQAADKILDVFTQLSDEALHHEPKPDFLVWPETTYPAAFRSPLSNRELARDQRLEDYVNSRGVPLLFGGYDRKGLQDFNSLFMLSPDYLAPQDLQVFHKHILLPFGEYIPLVEKIEPLKNYFGKVFPQMGFFGRGPGPEVFTLQAANKKLLHIAPIICYEALFPWFTLESARNGNDLILNITNDSWFGPYGEPYLHLALTVMRSIETRLPQLRSTNTGISTLILPNGKMIQSGGIMTREVLHYEVPVIDSPQTLMKLWGNWFGVFTIFACLATYFIGRVFKKSQIE